MGVHFPGKEVFFGRDELIVSKTDPQGRITYANDMFLRIAGYRESECVGQQHNMIRNPNMPRTVFSLLWETVAEGREIFAYVVNSTKDGNHYWVIAHVTPSIADGRIVGYHSTRRVPNGETVRRDVLPLYERLNAIEKANSSKKAGLQEARDALRGMLAEKGLQYDEFVAALMRND